MSHEKPRENKIPPSKEDVKKKFDNMMGKATDMQLVDFLSKHIDRPCEVEVSPGEIRNIRQFYIDLAKDALGKLTNPFARELLEKKIREYEKE